jgi:PAS domain S-box-containing protein
MFFGRKDKKAKANASAVRDAKVAASQHALMSAAVETSHMAQDVTRTMQKRMDDAIRQFIQTARIMNDALLICDPVGNIQAFNPAAQRVFGLPDHPTQPCTALFQKGSLPVDAEELWKLGRSKKRTLSGVHADGTKFPAHIRVSSLDRSDGTTIVILVIQDLTLIQKNFNNSIHGYAIVSQSEIIAANTSICRMFGYEQEDLLGRCAEVLMGSKDRAGNHLDLAFEIARVMWEGEEAMLVIVRETRAEACPDCGRRGYHTH